MRFCRALLKWLVLLAGFPLAAQPVVTLSSPTNHARFGKAVGMELNVQLRASVVNPPPSPYSFSFFADGVLIGYGTSQNGNSMIWSNVSFGSHLLTAGFDGMLLSNPLTISVEAEGIAIVNEVAVWKYLDGGADPGPIWFTADADLSTWPSGLPQFGFGDQDERTWVNFLNPTNGLAFPAYYFHHTFEITNAASYTNLVARLLRDDGAIVYLNRHELFRDNMPAGPVDYTTYASAPAVDETEFTDHWIDPRLLLNGTNHIAVEVHNQLPTSMDISFDLRLLANLPIPPPSISATRIGNSLVCAWPRTYLGYRLEMTGQLGTGDWQVMTNVVTTPANFISTNLIAPPAKFFRLAL